MEQSMLQSMYDERGVEINRLKTELERSNEIYMGCLHSHGVAGEVMTTLEMENEQLTDSNRQYKVMLFDSDKQISEWHTKTEELIEANDAKRSQVTRQAETITNQRKQINELKEIVTEVMANRDELRKLFGRWR